MSMCLIEDQAENSNEMFFSTNELQDKRRGKGQKNKLKLLDSDILVFQLVDFGSNRVELILQLILPALCFP